MGWQMALLATAGRLVAVGDDGHGSPISWTSDDDGTTWRAGRRVQGVDGNFDAVIETPTVLVASIASPDLTSAIAVSGNGRSWEIVADPEHRAGARSHVQVARTLFLDDPEDVVD